MRSSSPSSSDDDKAPSATTPPSPPRQYDDGASQAASDEAILARLGYKQEFRREFTNLSVSPPPSPTSPALLASGTRGQSQLTLGTALSRNLQTISFAFSIMGVASSVVTTFNTPFGLGGPASVVWCWFMVSRVSVLCAPYEC